jgi:predicted nucleic acid-binding protein
MTSSSFLNNEAILVADASVVINLNATGCAFDIIQALPGSFVVTKNAFDELSAGARNGHNDAKMLEALVGSGVVRLVEMGKIGKSVYSSLVEGAASRTLDDGEAATISYAHENAGVAMIDEKKALSICQDDFPTLKVISTIDLLTHELIRDALGTDGQISSIFNALRKARMRIPLHQVGMIVNLIGYEAAAACSSLPKSAAGINNGREKCRPDV